MATDQGPVVQSALLRNELVRLRKESRLTQEQVADALEWSPSKLIRIEGGRSSITKVDLDALLSAYGVTSEGRREQLQALNEGLANEPFGTNTATTSSDFNYVGLEAGAAFIRAFESSYVPACSRLLLMRKHDPQLGRYGQGCVGCRAEAGASGRIGQTIG